MAIKGFRREKKTQGEWIIRKARYNPFRAHQNRFLKNSTRQIKLCTSERRPRKFRAALAGYDNVQGPMSLRRSKLDGCPFGRKAYPLVWRRICQSSATDTITFSTVVGWWKGRWTSKSWSISRAWGKEQGRSHQTASISINLSFLRVLLLRYLYDVFVSPFLLSIALCLFLILDVSDANVWNAVNC